MQRLEKRENRRNYEVVDRNKQKKYPQTDILSILFLKKFFFFLITFFLKFLWILLLFFSLCFKKIGKQPHANKWMTILAFLFNCARAYIVLEIQLIQKGNNLSLIEDRYLWSRFVDCHGRNKIFFCHPVPPIPSWWCN